MSRKKLCQCCLDSATANATDRTTHRHKCCGSHSKWAATDGAHNKLRVNYVHERYQKTLQTLEARVRSYAHVLCPFHRWTSPCPFLSGRRRNEAARKLAPYSQGVPWCAMPWWSMTVPAQSSIWQLDAKERRIACHCKCFQQQWAGLLDTVSVSDLQTYKPCRINLMKNWASCEGDWSRNLFLSIFLGFPGAWHAMPRGLHVWQVKDAACWTARQLDALYLTKDCNPCETMLCTCQETCCRMSRNLCKRKPNAVSCSAQGTASLDSTRWAS